VHSEWGDVASQTDRFGNWEALYKYIRGFNELKANIPLMTAIPDQGHLLSHGFQAGCQAFTISRWPAVTAVCR